MDGWPCGLSGNLQGCRTAYRLDRKSFNHHLHKLKKNEKNNWENRCAGEGAGCHVQKKGECVPGLSCPTWSSQPKLHRHAPEWVEQSSDTGVAQIPLIQLFCAPSASEYRACGLFAAVTFSHELTTGETGLAVASNPGRTPKT